MALQDISARGCRLEGKIDEETQPIQKNFQEYQVLYNTGEVGSGVVRENQFLRQLFDQCSDGGVKRSL